MNGWGKVKIMVKQCYEKPECYKPEKDTPYPLCIGAQKEECICCCLYIDYPEPPFESDEN